MLNDAAEEEAILFNDPEAGEARMLNDGAVEGAMATKPGAELKTSKAKVTKAKTKRSRYRAKDKIVHDPRQTSLYRWLS